MIIGRQVAKLRWVGTTTYTRAPEPPLFRVESDARDLYEDVVSAYRHRVVWLIEQEDVPKIEAKVDLTPGEGQQMQTPVTSAVPVLALCPHNQEDEATYPPLLELDERGRPLAGSGPALKAIGLGNAILDDEFLHIDRIREAITGIHELVGSSDPALTELLFERIHRWASSKQLLSKIPEVYWLLPWTEMRQHLIRLEEVLGTTRRKAGVGMTVSTSDLPELGHSFAYLAPGFAPALREITEWRSPQDAPENRQVNALVRQLSRIESGQVPVQTKADLVSALDATGRWLQHRIYEWTTPREHRIACLAMATSYTAMLRFGATVGRDRAAGELRCLGRLVLAADAGNYLAGRVPISNQVLDLMRDRATQFLGGASVVGAETRDPIDRHDRLLDAADVLRFVGGVALVLDRNPGRAAELAFAAHEKYDSFSQYLDLLPWRQRRWANHVPQNYLLRARALIAQRDYSDAGQVLLEMWKKLPLLTPEASEHTVSLYRAELLGELHACVAENGSNVRAVLNEIGVEEPLETAIEEVEAVLEENFANHKAWRLLISFRSGDERAVALIEETIRAQAAAGEEISAGDRSALRWLQYQLALVARQRAEEDPELALDAFSAYLDVLVAQDRNTAVIGEVLEVYSQLPDEEAVKARELVDRELAPISDPNCPFAHAVLRVGIRRETTTLGESEPHAAAALSEIAWNPSPATVAVERLKDEILAVRPTRRALEPLTKWLYEAGRSAGDHDALLSAARLLDAAIAAVPNDPIWWTRRADIAILDRDLEAGSRLIEELAASLKDDSLVHFQIARLLLVRGELAQADKELADAETIDKKSTGEDLPHPAISDKRAFIALREGRFSRAEDLYLAILRTAPHDPIARYGLGRVYLESPDHSVHDALHEWLMALRVQVERTSTESQRHGWSASIAIGGLIRDEISADTPDRRDPLLSAFQDIASTEDTKVLSRIVDGLRVLGVVDRPLAELLLDPGNEHVNRRIAQFLMARTIHTYIESGDAWATYLSEELPAYVEWAHRHEVLGDFLAGAKGSYARATLRAELSSADSDQERAQGASVRNRHLKRLVHHVVNTRYSRTYYADTYRELAEAGLLGDDELVAAAAWIVSDLASRIRADQQATETDATSVIQFLQPAVGLTRVRQAVARGLAEKVTALVDLDALALASEECDLSDWQVAGTQLTATAAHAPFTESARRGYWRAGLMWFEENGGSGSNRCAVDLLDEGATADQELDPELVGS